MCPLPGVSFVVPVYNKAPHLPRVLAQIKAQRGNFQRQYVFVDDGSTDNSLGVLRKETAGWSDVTIECQENQGSAGATNAGIALSNQPFIKFVDADDLLHEDATLHLLEALKDSEACLIYGGVYRFANGEKIDLRRSLGDADVDTIETPLLPALKNSLFNPTQFLARTEAIKQVRGCDERVVHSQEYGLTLRLARQWSFLRSSATVAYIPQDAPGRLSTNEGRQLQRVTLAVANFLKDHPDLPFSVKQFACRRLAGRAWRYARRRGGERKFGRWFWINLAAQFPLPRDHGAFATRCVAAFELAERSGVDERAPNYENPCAE
jgi:glycosyltransferase involved in cell wall biosynthesis